MSIFKRKAANGYTVRSTGLIEICVDHGERLRKGKLLSRYDKFDNVYDNVFDVAQLNEWDQTLGAMYFSGSQNRLYITKQGGVRLPWVIRG